MVETVHRGFAESLRKAETIHSLLTKDVANAEREIEIKKENKHWCCKGSREAELFNDLLENGELFIDFGLCNIKTERGLVYRHLKFFFLVWFHTV